MRIATALSKISWRDVFTSVMPLLLAFVAVSVLALRFLQPAPPTKLTISGGPEGSTFARAAQRYAKILAHNGVTLNILASDGSQQNLHRLLDDNAKVDVAFVQGGLAGTLEPDRLLSLGSLFYEPLYVFYRSPAPMLRLSELRGRRIAIGPEGSGTRALALALLKANGIEATGGAQLSDLGGKAAGAALAGRQVDAVFMMSDSSAPDDVRALLHSSDVRLFDFAQTDAYIRHFRYLSKLELGQGTFDLGDDIPAKPVTLLAPTVELVTRRGLHPALSDLLIEAARNVHGHAGLLHQANEFPAPLEHEYSISDDATRYYKSGKTLSYRYMPFWLASLVDRILVVVVPALLVLVPALRLIPAVYNWRIRRRIHRRYADLMTLERVALNAPVGAERQKLLARVEEIDKAVINLKMPPAFANDVYVLREHIKFVRDRLEPAAAAASVP